MTVQSRVHNGLKHSDIIRTLQVATNKAEYVQPVIQSLSRLTGEAHILYGQNAHLPTRHVYSRDYIGSSVIPTTEHIN